MKEMEHSKAKRMKMRNDYDGAYYLDGTSSDSECSTDNSEHSSVSSDDGSDPFVWGQVETNDPGLSRLLVDPDYLLSNGVEWDVYGQWIGSHAYLKELQYRRYQAEPTEEEFISFFHGVSHNRSIQTLRLNKCSLYDCRVFHILSQFFARNQDFKTLHLDSCLFDRHKACHLNLAVALSKFQTLEAFIFSHCHNLGDSELGEVIGALGTHSRQLQRLDLTGNELGAHTCHAVSNLLRNPSFNSLSTLILYNGGLTDQCAAILASGLENSKLTHLDLGKNAAITHRGWQAIFFSSPNIRNLNVSFCALGGDSVMALARNTQLKSLNLSSNKLLHTLGWQSSLYLLFHSTEFLLEELDLSSNGFADREVTYLANALMNNRTLKSLRMCSNPAITLTGWRQFSRVLESSGSALAKLHISNNNMSDESVIVLANSLANNRQLTDLEIENLFIRPNQVWNAFSHILCNSTSIADTHMSNHTLEQICWRDEDHQLPSHIRTFLRQNREHSECQAARQKIARVHFMGEFDMQPFTIDMKLTVLPYAIAWMAARDITENTDEVIGRLYYFLRSFASLFDLDARVKNPSNN